MAGVRIKDLQDAKSVIDKFDDMQFAVDSGNPDTTLKLSGKDLKTVIGTPKHTHEIEEVTGLPGVLEKKLDTTGGTITGDLRVEGNTHVKNLRVDEYLEVPELKYNRITATGNEFWVTDGGTVDDVAQDGDGIYLITLKSKEDEATINFQFKDILRGIFYTENEQGDPAGFRTAYYEVTGVVDQTRFYCIPLTIKNNMASYAQMHVECEVVYVDPDTSAETTAKTSISYAKTENAGQLICAIAYAPGGTVFKNGSATSLKAHCDMWRGSTIDNTLVVYTWYKLGSGVWTEITSSNAGGITGYTTNEITIPESAVLNFESFKCEIRDNDPASGTYNTTVADIISFADMSDPYQVEITTPQGTTLTSGLTQTTLTAQVWQNGALLTDTFFTGATCRWRKYDKNGVLDATWGSAGIKTGRSITVTRAEISVAATFTVEIDK